jgi:hypothetical protein
VVVAPGVPGERRIRLVHVDRHAELPAGALGEADVVEVRVREDDGLDVVGPPAERAERVVQGVPRRRDARVDDREPAVLLDEVPVRVRVLDPVDALHRVGVQGHGLQGLSRILTAPSCFFWNIS